MDTLEAIKKRHSYRGEFTEDRVPREDLEKIVQAGIDAPSGCNAQTTTFVIVDDPEVITKVGEIVPNPVLRGARAIIVCVAEERAVYKGMSFAIEDCSAAVENMLLAITALGYATVWIDGGLRMDRRDERISELLAIPADLQVRVILPMGRPVEARDPKEKMPFDQRSWFNRYGA